MSLMRVSRSRSRGSLAGKAEFLIELFTKRNVLFDKVRSSIPSDVGSFQPDRELQLFLAIPKFDARQISKFAEFYDESSWDHLKIRDFDYSASCSDLQFLTELNKRKRTPSDVSCFIVFFQGVAAGLLHPDQLNSVTFQLLVDLLAKIINSDYCALGQDVFGILWHVAVVDHEVEFDVNCFSSVIAYLNANQELSGDYYSLFVEFTGKAIDSGNKQVIESIFSLLFSLFDDDRPLVRGRSHDKLIQIMEPFIHKFNHRALFVLARMSRATESRAIEDTYIVLPSCFLDFIQKSSDSITIEEKDADVLEYTDGGAKFDFRLSSYDDFRDGLLPLPDVVLENFVPTNSLLAEDVQKVAEELNANLTCSNPVCVNLFFSTYVKLLSGLSTKGKFYDAFVAFLGVYGKTRPEGVFDFTLPFLLSPVVLSPKHTVFCEGTLSPVMNSLRNSIIDLIIANDIRRMPEVVDATAKYPVLCAEMIARVCGKNVPVSLFADSRTLNNLVKLAVYFQTRRESVPMRNAVFILMFRLCVDEQTSLVCFSVSEFISCYFRFLFESNLCDMVLGVFKEACYRLSKFGSRCIIETTINYLVKVFGICAREGYSELVVKLASSISAITKMAPSIVLWFAPVIKPMLESLQVVCKHELLVKCLELIFSVSQADEEFMMSGELFHLILSSIRKIGMTDSIYLLLLSCLACSHRVKKDGMFLIQSPSFLPLTVAACSDKYSLMKLFNGLVTYSLSNAIAMHDGDVDMILLDYLAAGQGTATVSYAGTLIEFSFKDVDVKTLVQPLLLRICSCKSSYAVAHKFLQLALAKEPMAKLLNSVLATVTSWPRPVFPLGPYDHVCSITGLNSTALSSKFSISMWMNVDGPALRAIRGETVIMSIDDSQQLGHFEIFMSMSELYAKFEYNNIRTSVKLLKHVPMSEWFLLTIIVQNFKEGALLVTYVDKDRRMDSEMCCIMLHQGPMEIRIGGHTGVRGELRTRTQTILIGNLRIFSCELGDDDIHRLWAGIACREEFLVLNTGDLTTAYRTATEVRNNVTFKIKQRICYTKPITYHMKDGVLLDMLTAGINCGHRNLILGLLELCFKYSREIQGSFMSTDQLICTLSQPSFCVDARVYQMVLAVYSAITEETLKYEWFVSVILNIWVWTRADAKSLLQILYIWKTSILCSHVSLFQKQSLFSKLIGQFSVIFGTDEYLARLESDNPDCLSFMTRGTKDEIDQVRSCFFDFITRVGELKLEQDDVDALFCCCLRSDASDIVLMYLKAIRSLTPGIVRLTGSVGLPQEFMHVLHFYVTSKDVRICLEAIFAIHDLVGHRLQEEMLFIACELQNGEKLKFIYQQLMQKIGEYPNLYPLLLLLAINLDDDLRGTASACLKALTNEPINTDGNWYIWPALYAFFVNETRQDLVLDFIATIALRKGRQEIELVFLYITLLQATLECGASNLPSLFVRAVYTKMSVPQDDILHSLFMAMASVLCFDFTTRSHSKRLVEAFNSSIFRLEEDFVPIEFPTIRVKVRNIQDICNFFHLNFDQLQPKYELQFSESDDVDNSPLCRMMRDIATQLHDAKALEFIEYFMTRASKGSLASLGQTLNGVRERYAEQFRENTKSITESVCALFKQARNDQLSLRKFDDSLLLGIGPQKEAWALPKAFVDVNDKVGKMKRDDVLCRSIVPMKLKRKHRVFRKRESCPEPPKYSTSCIIFMFCKAKEVTFSVTQTSVVISGFGKGDKIIPFRMIESLWPRDNGGTNTRIEILTTNGLLFLLDFTPTSNAVVMSHIQAANEQLCQRQMSPKTDEWQDGKLSNFDYILRLNLCSGRTFNDPALYPIFPALVADFANCYKCRDFIKSMKSVTPPPMQRCGNASLGIGTLKDDLTKPNFLAPEFFCFPHVVDESDELPPWAHSGFELVYTLRKVLESPHVSALLSAWIDAVWGIYHPGQLPHRQLFGAMHLPKKMRHQVRTPALSAATTIVSRLKLAHCDGCRLMACTADGNVYFADVAIDPSGISVSNYTAMRLPAGIPVDGNTSQVFLYSQHPSRLITVSSDQTPSSCQLHVVDNMMSVSETAVAFCPTPSSIRLRLRDGSGECLVCRTTARVACIALSESFHLIAYGTVASTLHIVSTTNYQEVRALPVDGGVPEAVLITQNWGFVVTRTHTAVLVFTVNGELIRKALLTSHILRWTTFASDAGFDYLAFQTADFELFACEVPRPDLATRICKCRTLVSIAYNNALEAFVLVTSSGKVKCAPHPVSQELASLPVTL